MIVEPMQSAEIRQRFLDYFTERGHQEVRSSALVPPTHDQSLLFTNSGMVQFKDIFLGKKTPPYACATSAQRCIRAGGKHDDLDNVGYTARHHTFFEMLGNFSFGKYFKQEAIEYAWDLITSAKGYSIPVDRLWVTVCEGDIETAHLWTKHTSIDPHRILFCSKKDNFWSMGPVGPCGPCSEIFYDQGPSVFGGLPGTQDGDGDRYLEIWNLVFMQYETLESGEIVPLNKPCVDTGMGLERISSVLQGHTSNYESDLFQPMIDAILQMTQTDQPHHVSVRVIADHIRACTALIADGITPHHDGRGYVLRRILRRAVRHGYQLGLRDPFMSKVLDVFGPIARQSFLPHLSQEHVKHVLDHEERQFFNILEQGMHAIHHFLDHFSGHTIPGDRAFRWYDTYGFPIDIIKDIAQERHMMLDVHGFDQCMQAQRQRSKANQTFVSSLSESESLPATRFHGYEKTDMLGHILAIRHQSKPAHQLSWKDEGCLALDQTVFYAESGGQVSDQGVIQTSEGVFRVTRVHRVGDVYWHEGVVEEGVIRHQTDAQGTLDCARRLYASHHHSATHLLHAALRHILGAHVQQRGSLVSDQRLRFDFSHHLPIDHETLVRIEQQVQHAICQSIPIITECSTLQEALDQGAIALFSDQYSDTSVRVLKMGHVSIELCGGTHARCTSDIGLFKILSEGGIASGIRRIEAVASQAAFDWLRDMDQSLYDLSKKLQSTKQDVIQSVYSTLEQMEAYRQQIQKLEQQQAQMQVKQIIDTAHHAENCLWNGVDCVVDLKKITPLLRSYVQNDAPCFFVLRDQSQIGILTHRIDAHLILNHMKVRWPHLKGGGRSNYAQLGGHPLPSIQDLNLSLQVWMQSRPFGSLEA